MKKKVIAVLLASMMTASMVPATAMAEEQTDIQSAEDVQGEVEDTSAETEDEDFFAEEGEEQDIEEEAPSEEVQMDTEAPEELTEDETEDTLELDGNTDESESVSEEADPFGLSDGAVTEAAGTVTINGVAFDTAKTYIVPLTLKNAHNLEQDSAAVACPGKFGTLTFEADGTPKVSTNLRSVTVGTLTDYAYDFKIYQGVKPSGETVAADIVATQTVAKADGSGSHEVPETISFAIPKDTFSQNGVYLSMYVDAMGYAPDAYLQIDYAGAKESGDPSLNFTTEISTAEVEQFGNYNVTSQVTVKDGRITDVVLEGNDFKGSHADDNQMYLNKAINGLGSTKGMKEKLTGLYMNDAQKLNDLDTVSGATYSSNAIKNATMNALGVKIEQEVIPDAPSEKPAAGLYAIEIKDRTDVVDHGLVGESKKATAYLRVDNDGKMWLTYKMVSGTVGEPLYVLGYNGYYPNGDTTQPLTKEGVTYATENTTAPTIGDCTVVTDITVPLDGVSQTYINNVYLYVEAMKNLNGEVSGVNFDAGKFNINSTITLYWDTLVNISEDTDSDALAKLSDGVYKLNGEMVKVNKVDKSMSNNAINHNVKLVVKNGLPYVNMNFNSMTITALKGYLKNLSYYATGYTVSKTGEPSGTLVPVTVNSLQQYSNGKTLKDDFGTDYPNDITFPLCQEAMLGETYIPMQVFVPIMDAIQSGAGTQNVYLKLDYSTLTKTTDSDADFAETEKAPADPSTIQKQEAQSITVAAKNDNGVISKKYGDKAFSLGAKAKTALTYKSSNTGVAAVDSKGNVTIKGAGTANITITAQETKDYKKATRTITVKVTRVQAAQTVTVSVKNSNGVVSKKYGDKAFSLGAKAKTGLTYKSSNAKVATVDSKGNVTIKGVGTANIVITAQATKDYKAATRTITVKVAKVQAAQSITVAVKNTKGVVSKKYGDKAFSLGAKAKTGLTYKSSNTRIATVDSKGNVAIKAAGTVTITISAKASTDYKAATKTMTVKISKAAPVLKTKITSKTIAYNTLKKNAQVFTLGASVNSKGTLTYTKVSGNSAFTVNKTNGKITVKKGLKKGTYKINVKISAKAKGNYNAGSKTVSVTVKVK